MNDCAKITNLGRFVSDCYDLSTPQGLGVLHYREGSLPDDVLDSICDSGPPIIMDYVLGRSVKMGVFLEKGHLWFRSDTWYDHSPVALAALIAGQKGE